MTGLTTRELLPEDIDAFMAVSAGAFLHGEQDPAEQRYRALLEPARSHGTFDGAEMIGAATRLDVDITVPGEVPCPVAAVTAVGVKPGHRRRGVLTALMRRQLDVLHEQRVAPIAALYASEGSIYGRFGYGAATSEAHLALPRGSRFLSTVEIDGRPVRETGADAAPEVVERCHPEVAARRVGWLSRADGSWRVRILQRPARDGEGSVRCAVHPDGYALYRAKPEWTVRGPAYRLHVEDLAAKTPRAYAALWRYLLDIDLVAEVRWDKAAVDEPVVNMLADPRAAARQVVDGLWVRLVDVDRALAARRYSAPVDVVLDVTDAFCSWNAGRWRLRADSSGVAEITRSTAEPQLRLDVADLGAVHLGGHTLVQLARAGRVAELDPGALRSASRAFATDAAPHCPEGF